MPVHFEAIPGQPTAFIWNLCPAVFDDAHLVPATRFVHGLFLIRGRTTPGPGGDAFDRLAWRSLEQDFC